MSSLPTKKEQDGGGGSGEGVGAAAPLFKLLHDDEEEEEEEKAFQSLADGWVHPQEGNPNKVAHQDGHTTTVEAATSSQPTSIVVEEFLFQAPPTTTTTRKKDGEAEEEDVAMAKYFKDVQGMEEVSPPSSGWIPKRCPASPPTPRPAVPRPPASWREPWPPFRTILPAERIRLTLSIGSPKV